jgi:CRISPR type I-E-associated protein CasB/Cse2
LYEQLGYQRDRDNDERLVRVGVLAAVLANVRSEAPKGHRFAATLGAGEQPRMSPHRFRQLLAARADPDLLISFRRAVMLVGAEDINIADVAALILDWSDITRRNMAFDYYQASNAIPTTEE